MALTHWSLSVSAPTCRTHARKSNAPNLLLVALDDSRVARVSRVLVESSLAQRAPLPQEIPAPIEGHLELLEAATMGIVRGSARLPPPQVVLLLDE
jgi:hypothetical protein